MNNFRETRLYLFVRGRSDRMLATISLNGTGVPYTTGFSALLLFAHPAKFTRKAANIHLDRLLMCLSCDQCPNKGLGGYEYTIDDLTNMPSKSWVIVDGPSNTKDIRTSAASLSYGSIVILVTYSQSFCGYVPDYGRWCEGDMMGLALSSVEYITAQIKKLETAGYPK